MKDEKTFIKKTIHFNYNLKKNFRNKNLISKIKPQIRIRPGTNEKKNELKQILDFTISHFTIKCSFLCNQIEQMKKEFIEQLEFIKEKEKENKKLYYLSNKKPPKLNNENIEFDSLLSLNSFSKEKNYRNYSSQNNLILDYENKKVNLTVGNENQKELIDKKNTGNKTIKSVIKLDEIKKNPDLDDKLLIKNVSEKKIMIQLEKINQPYSKKELVIINLMKSKILSFKEKLKLRFINRRIYNDFPEEKIINKSKKNYLKEIKKLEIKYPEKQISITSSSNLSFINKTFEKETLTNEKKKNNIKFLYAISILKDVNYNNLKQAESVYKLILKETKFDCIKNLFISYLKYLNRNAKNKKEDALIKFVDYIDNNKELLEPNDMIKDNNQMISLYSFGLKEVYTLFKQEIKKRKEKNDYLNLINQIKELENKIKRDFL